jgi:transglutaminase-like putative cysteine protease
VALFAGTVIGFLLLHRMARQDGSSHWVADRRVAGNRSLLLAGSGLGVIAVVAGSVLWPAVPGAHSAGYIDAKDIGANDPRRTLSPLVDIRSRLVDQAAVEMFRVQSPVRSYWRLTSLEDFDGDIWSSSGSYGKEDGELPESLPLTVDSEEFEQSITISNLSAIWLPSAYEPRAIDIDDTEVRYEEESATLIVDNDLDSSDGLTYRVTSKSPRIEPDDLSGTPDEIPGDIRDHYLGLPDDFSPRVRELAEQTIEGAPTPAAQARALQDYLHEELEYSLAVQPRHGDDPLEDFLFENRVGYCQQFAGAFAAMARSVGIPTRVAVGFTPGELDPETDDTYIVRGEYAHAWPEVFIAGAGWVPYEPTPNRGIPNALSYTGYEEQQAEAGNSGGVEITPTTAPAETIPTLPNDDPSDPQRNPDDELLSGGQSSGDGSSDSSGADIVLTVIFIASVLYVVLVLAWVVLLPIALLVRRARRRRRAETPLDQVELAWIEAAEAAGIAGFHERLSDTHIERALEVGARVPAAADPALTIAARLEVGIYSADGADGEDAEVAWQASEAIQQALREQTSWRDRLNWWLNPAWLLRSWRRERAARQRRITLTPRGDLEAERELVGSDDRG